MTKWTFEPGHTAAEFSVRHMMVTWVRGHFKAVEGTLIFDPKNPAKSSVEITIKAKNLSTGDKYRDDHLRSKDFLNVEKYPTIKLTASEIE